MLRTGIAFDPFLASANALSGAIAAFGNYQQYGQPTQLRKGTVGWCWYG